MKTSEIQIRVIAHPSTSQTELLHDFKRLAQLLKCCRLKIRTYAQLLEVSAPIVHQPHVRITVTGTCGVCGKEKTVTCMV